MDVDQDLSVNNQETKVVNDKTLKSNDEGKQSITGSSSGIIEQNNQTAVEVNQSKISSEFSQLDKLLSSEALNQYKFSGDRQTLIYNDRLEVNKNDSTQPSNNDQEEDDDFYELSLGEAQKLLREIKRTRDELENGQLTTKAMRDLNNAKKTLTTLHQYNYSVIRIHFPNGYVIQAIFKPLENISKVKQFLQNYLENPNIDFYLYITPPKIILEDNSTLLDLKCVPAANFYFALQKSSPTKSDYSSNRSENSLDIKLENNTSTIQPVLTSEGESIQPVSESTNNKHLKLETDIMETSENNAGSSSNETGLSPSSSNDSSSLPGGSNGIRLGSTNNELSDNLLQTNYIKHEFMKNIVSRNIADIKAAEYRKSRNTTLDDGPSGLILNNSASNEPSTSSTTINKANRPRTSQDNIPKWFKTGK